MPDDAWTLTLLAPNFRVRDWYEVRDRLDPQKYDAQWRRVLSHIAARFNERFVGPADALIGRDKRFRRVPAGPGFAVLALDCILIETLFGYERGARTQRGETGSAFIAFLKSQTGFDKGDRAASFARAVRNGVIHDGETRDGWTVWKGYVGGPLVNELADKRQRVYRDAFHGAVKAYLANYLVRLHARDADATRLRGNFKTRIDRLCKDSAPRGIAP